jgi:hypothetical protein
MTESARMKADIPDAAIVCHSAHERCPTASPFRFYSICPPMRGELQADGVPRPTSHPRAAARDQRDISRISIARRDGDLQASDR